MKFTRYFLALWAVGLGALALGQGAKSPPDTGLLEKALEPLLPEGNQVGRFALFNAQEYAGARGPQVLRIDTATGQVWSLSTVSFSDGQFTPQGWLAVSEKEIFQYGMELPKVEKPKVENPKR